MTDLVYQNIQYPLKKIVRILVELDDLNSIPPEYLTPEQRDATRKEINDFIIFWEGQGKPVMKSLITRLREKAR